LHLDLHLIQAGDKGNTVIYQSAQDVSPGRRHEYYGRRSPRHGVNQKDEDETPNPQTGSLRTQSLRAFHYVIFASLVFDVLG
jgi:hypothetical protein